MGDGWVEPTLSDTSPAALAQVEAEREGEAVP